MAQNDLCSSSTGKWQDVLKAVRYAQSISISRGDQSLQFGLTVFSKIYFISLFANSI